MLDFNFVAGGTKLQNDQAAIILKFDNIVSDNLPEIMISNPYQLLKTGYKMMCNNSHEKLAPITTAKLKLAKSVSY
jgi:hypothetical protein